MYIDRSPLTVTCNSFFTVLMLVDKTGLQFYFFLLPFFNSKHFFPTVFTTVLQTAKKKKRKEKEEKFSKQISYFHFLFINFFSGVQDSGTLVLSFWIAVIDRDKNFETEELSSCSVILTSHFLNKVYLQILVIKVF